VSISAKAIENEIIRKMMASEEVHHKLDAVVKEAQEKAKSRAPVFTKKRGRRKEPPWDSPHLHAPGSPEDYKNSIVIEMVKGKPHVRRLISRDYKAVWIEIGTRHMPEYAILTNIAREYGSTTGPSFSEGSDRVSTEDEGVRRHHDDLRQAIKDMETLVSGGAKGKALNSIRNDIDSIRNKRSAAFKAAEPRRRRRRR
jgi:hypothetical protein